MDKWIAIGISVFNLLLLIVGGMFARVRVIAVMETQIQNLTERDAAREQRQSAFERDVAEDFHSVRNKMQAHEANLEKHVDPSWRSLLMDMLRDIKADLSDLKRRA